MVFSVSVESVKQPASSSRDLLITQMEVTFSPLLQGSRIKHPSLGHEWKNLEEAFMIWCVGIVWGQIFREF